MRFIDGRQRLVYYDRDGSGNAIMLNSVSVALTFELTSASTACQKHSRNVLERGVHVRPPFLVVIACSWIAVAQQVTH